MKKQQWLMAVIAAVAALTAVAVAIFAYTKIKKERRNQALMNANEFSCLDDDEIDSLFEDEEDEDLEDILPEEPKTEQAE